MSVIATALKHMLASGMPHEAIVAAIAEMEACSTRVRSSGAERQARYRRQLDVSADEWETLRLRTFERDEFQCVYCGADVSGSPQCDHVHPLSLGGFSELQNLATACKACNSSKKDTPLADWLRRPN